MQHGRGRSGPGRPRATALRGRVTVLVILVAVLLAGGIGGYLAFGLAPAQAVYLAVLALTTEGFGGGLRLSGPEELFTAALAVLGVTVFLAVVGVLGAALVEGGPGLGRRRRMQRKIGALRGHYIICAYGRVGRTVAREFEAEGVAYLVIEARAELEEELQRDGVLYLHGNPSSEEVLRQAGIGRARGLVCAVDSDAENVFITLVARSLNPDISIVARAGEATSADRLYRAGANRVVSPYVASGRRMALLALRPHVVDLLEITQRGDSQYRLEELLISADSALAGRTLGDGCGAAIPLLLRRSDGTVLPSPAHSTVLGAGDVVVVFGEKGTLAPIETR
jgi:voltage-gated potassium channel